MKLSQTDKNKLKELTIKQKTCIVFGNYKDDGLLADVALLLGTNLKIASERAKTASKLYFDGRVKYIMPSGGVEWEYEGEKVSEALYMAQMLKKMNVPDEAIILENESRTTVENMICSTLKLRRTIGIFNFHSVIIVTSPSHIRRSVELAKCFMPKSKKISGYAGDNFEYSKNHWFESETDIKNVDSEVYLLKELIDNKMIDDIEY